MHLIPFELAGLIRQHVGLDAQRVILAVARGMSCVPPISKQGDSCLVMGGVFRFRLLHDRFTRQVGKAREFNLRVVMTNDGRPTLPFLGNGICARHG